MTLAALKTHRRIADIELLRGVAVLFVIAHHAHGNLVSWSNPAVESFYRYFQFDCGVDLFFAISGFVIARSLVPMLAGCGTPQDFARATLGFWVRRAWRLLPSAWLWLAIVLAASVLFNRSGLYGSFHANFEATVAALLDVANFRFQALFGSAPYGASFPYWSLSLEEQFYLLFPVVIFLSGRWLAAVMAVGVLAQLFLVRSVLLMSVRTDALMLGVLIALWSRTETYRLFEPRVLARHPAARWAVLVFGLLLLAAVSGSGERIASFRVGVVALICAGLVFVASFGGDYLMRDGGLKRTLLWVGSRSYALYLVHVPVMFGMRELWLRLEIQPVHGHGWGLVLLALGLMALLAELNFRLVETPLRLKGARIADAMATRPRPAPAVGVPTVSIAGHGRIADIELLRGIAILFTLYEHIPYNLVTWANPVLNGIASYFHFASGVDLFLVISGFVIARGLVPSLARCGTRVEFARVTLAFWVRRAWRLLPSAWLWLALILLACVAFNRSGAFYNFQTNFDATVAALLNLANARLIAAWDHFNYGASSSYWSLSLEEQFYLLFPVLIFASRRRLPLVLGGFILLQLFNVRGVPLMAFRTDGLMLGVLIALWSRTQTYRLVEPLFLRRSGLIRGAVLIGLLALLAALDVPDNHIVWFSFGLISLVSAVLVLVASFDGDYLMRDGLAKRLLLWCGSRSYALYLVHMPMMLAAREAWFRLGLPPAEAHFWGLVLPAFAAIGLAAELNYRLVELPLRRKGARIAEAMLAGLAAVPSAAPVASDDLAAGKSPEEALQIVG